MFESNFSYFSRDYSSIRSAPVSFNDIHEYKILAKISEFTVIFLFSLLQSLHIVYLCSIAQLNSMKCIRPGLAAGKCISMALKQMRTQNAEKVYTSEGNFCIKQWVSTVAMYSTPVSIPTPSWHNIEPYKENSLPSPPTRMYRKRKHTETCVSDSQSRVNGHGREKLWHCWSEQQRYRQTCTTVQLSGPFVIHSLMSTVANLAKS